MTSSLASSGFFSELFRPTHRDYRRREKMAMLMRRTSYGVIIVNYNSAQHVKRAVQSVLRYACTDDVRIQIVDNASESADRYELRVLAGEQVFVDEMRSNLGFARGNNEGVALLESRYKPDYLVFMNPDVEILSTGTIESLISTIVNSGPAVVGSQPLIWDARRVEAAEEQITIRRVPLYWDLIVTESLLLRTVFRRTYDCYSMADCRPYRRHVRFEVPSGAFFVIDRIAFHEVGGFDGRTFLYGEELFLGAKLKSRGWGFVLDPALRVGHTQGSSTGFSRRSPRRSMFNHHRRSTCLFARSHLGCSSIGSAFLRVAMEVGFLCRMADFAVAAIRSSLARQRSRLVEKVSRDPHISA